MRGRAARMSLTSGASGTWCALSFLAAIARQHPHRQIRVEFAPAHLRDFVASLTGIGQELDEGAEDRAERIGRAQDQRELGVVGRAVARHFLVRRLDAGERRRLDQAALFRPGEHLSAVGEGPVGGVVPVALGDARRAARGRRAA